MKMNIDDRNNLIVSYYLKGLSSGEIFELANWDLSIRQIQRIIKEAGITRDQKTAFRMAIDKGRVTYHKKPKGELKHRKRLSTAARMKVLKKYDYRCQLCGATAKDARIQIDHKDEDPSNNDEDNLWVLCEECNKGKHYLCQHS